MLVFIHKKIEIECSNLICTTKSIQSFVYYFFDLLNKCLFRANKNKKKEQKGLREEQVNRNRENNQKPGEL